MPDRMQTKSHVDRYYWIWVFLVLVLLLVRFVVIGEYDEKLIFNLFMVYFIFSWLALIAMAIYEFREEWRFLYERHGFAFTFGHDLNDPNVRQFKEHAKLFITLVLIVFFSMPVLFVIVMLEW